MLLIMAEKIVAHLNVPSDVCQIAVSISEMSSVLIFLIHCETFRVINLAKMPVESFMIRTSI